jgi:hypothetical protein
MFAILMLFAATLRVSAEKEGNDSVSVNNEAGPLFDFFSSDELLEITLQFNMREFIKTRMDPYKNFDARLSVSTEDNKNLSQDISLRARGKMRRKYCTFPPIMLKIKKDKDQEQVFPKGSIKLVTHCSSAGSFENYLLKEYLAYKLYNLVTPYSFKTRLVAVNYVDSLNPKRTFKEYGILIEDVDDLASRNNAIVIENLKIGQNHMNDYEMARVAFFNYMIGNTDWSVAEQHNIKVLKIDRATADKGIPVTYDFDYSGFVNTSYSSPNEKIPITNVTERYFQGGCYSDELFRQIISEFEDLEPQLMQTIEDFPYLQKAQKNLAKSYLKSFFKRYKKEDALIADINRTCLRRD